MKRLAASLLVVLAASGTVCAQRVSDEASDLQQVKEQLRDVVSALHATQEELHASQREIQSLRSEVDSMRAGNREPAPQIPPAPTAQQLANLDQQQQLLAARVDQQYQTKVESGSKYRVRLSGLVLFNASSTRGVVNEQDVPMLAERAGAGITAGNISATMRQTLVNVDVFGPEIAGARSSASMQFDFFGGFPDTVDGVGMGVARMRVGKAQLDWRNWSLMFGQDKPFISPNSPTSLATIGTPGFGYSGNLWTWTPQIVAERRWSGEELGAKLQFGILDPFNGSSPYDSFYRYPEAGERSRTPAFSARQSIDFGDMGHRSSVGVGGYFARQDYNYSRILDAWAATLDWNLILGQKFEVSGLFYRGVGLGGLWGGIGRSVVFDGSAQSPASEIYGVNTVGGWSQLKYKPASKWEINGGFGEDSPFAADLRHYSLSNDYAPYLRNWTTMLNVIERPRSNLMFSLEYRHLNTVDFNGKPATAENVNLGVGVSF